MHSSHRFWEIYLKTQYTVIPIGSAGESETSERDESFYLIITTVDSNENSNNVIVSAQTPTKRDQAGDQILSSHAIWGPNMGAREPRVSGVDLVSALVSHRDLWWRG